MKINIVGLGPAAMSGISLGAYEALIQDRVPVFVRTKKHPNIEKLEERGMQAVYLDEFYEKGDSFEEVYESIVDYLIVQTQKNDEITYAVPGHPFVAEKTVALLLEKARQIGIEIWLLPSMSFIDATFAAVQEDPSEGFALVDAMAMDEETIETTNHLLITQVYDSFIASDVKLKLLEIYEPEKIIALVKNAGATEPEKQQATNKASTEEKDNQEKNKVINHAGETVVKLPLEEMDRIDFDFDHLTSVFIPASKAHKHKNLNDLIEIVRTLRGEDGCPWDQKQTHESLKENIVEEAGEVKDAIEADDIDNLVEELGDVLLQIIFHSELGKESGYFNLSDVTHGICEKLIYRHPHVFAGLEIDEKDLPKLWQKLKTEEKNKKILKNR